MYIAPKSKIESRAHYAPEPAWGSKVRRQRLFNLMPVACISVCTFSATGTSVFQVKPDSTFTSVQVKMDC